MFDSPVHMLHIGGNLAQGLEENLAMYSNTLKSITYIECIPMLYEQLSAKLAEHQKQTHVVLKAVCALASDEDDKESDFFIANNEGQSSSMYPPNDKEWMWDWVSFLGKTRLRTITVDTLVKQGILREEYDTVVLDTQGSELNVLNGMLSILPKVMQLQTEYSKREFYKGGVLYDTLYAFLQAQGFSQVYCDLGDHGDMVLTRAG